MDLHLAQAVAAGVAAACIGSAALAQPASSPSAARPAQSIPDVSPEAPAVAQAGGREVSTGDPDEDAVLAMVADVQAHSILLVKDHETALRKVLADMPQPFVREHQEGDKLVFRGDSMSDCLAEAARLRPASGAPITFVCRGNPYPAAAFYLGSYLNEVGQPDAAIEVLDAGLVAAPDAPLLLTERNAAFIALHRWDDTLSGADRGLAIANLIPRDHARLLRNRGFALTELKRLDEARKAYEDSLQLESDNALAKNELTYIARLQSGGATAPSQIFMPAKQPVP
jgi:tetratricopeptide (TPR) repeat protein